MLLFIEIGKSEVIFVYGGYVVKIGEGKGYFVFFIVFKDVKDDVKIWKEEIFGFVVFIKIFEIEVEVIEFVNDIIYGLVLVVFMSDICKSYCMVEKL